MWKINAVRIMCDFCAEAVWSVPAIANSTMDGFRVSEELWQRIQAWQTWYENQDVGLEFDPAFDWEGHTAEGYVIAWAVKDELPDWIVI